MRHAILGSGGVGGVIGTVLAHAAEVVTLIVRPGTVTRYPLFRSLSEVVPVVETLKEPVDLLWVTGKATQLDSALAGIQTNRTIKRVIPLLNGVDHVERLRKRFGHERVIPATIEAEIERTEPSAIDCSPFMRLNVSAKGREPLAAVIPIFERSGFDCEFLDDEPTLLWSKLVFLAPMALSTAAARSTIGDVLGDPLRAQRLEACVHEACAVASLAGATVDANVVLSKIKGLPSGMRSLLERDIFNGNALEIDAIVGPILRSGNKHGLELEATRESVRELVEAHGKGDLPRG